MALSDDRRAGAGVPATRLVFSDEDRAAILAMVDESLRSGSLTLGPRAKELEAAFAARHGVPHAIAVHSGTSALEIVLRAVGVDRREVIVPANTFFASAAAVLHAGGVARLADVAPDTLALSAAGVEEACTSSTAAVMLVHIGGLITPEVDEIRDVCRRRGLFLLEDAAHAHGSTIDGRSAGTLGDAATFSFYPTKVITSGEGGMIVTGDERLRDEAVVYRDQGKAGFLGGEHIRLGAAWRMSELHAAVGLVHLRRLDGFIATRDRIARLYDAQLRDVDGITPLSRPARCTTNHYKYVALLDPAVDRAELKTRLRDEHGVALSGEVYARPLHHEPIFADLPHGSLPIAEDVAARQVCLPIHSDMTPEEAEYVVEAVAAALAAVRAERVSP